MLDQILASVLDIKAPTKIKLTDARAYRLRTWNVDKIIYQNRQWAVTTYGIENIAGPYHYYISKRDFQLPLGESALRWPDHMAEKNWVDCEAFNEVYAKACQVFA